jgi:hypothetical protein
VVFFHGFTKEKGVAKNTKTMAGSRDADRRRSASGDPAMVLMFRMASILSLVTGTVPVTPSGRIAAGRCTIEHDVFGKTVVDFSGFMLLRMIVLSKIAKSGFERSCKKRALTGARVLEQAQRRMLCFSISAL